MKIEILESTGIKQEPYGHMQQGELRVVDDQFGAFACANGWARDCEEVYPTGERGSLDRTDPAQFQPEVPVRPAESVEPKSARHK